MGFIEGLVVFVVLAHGVDVVVEEEGVVIAVKGEEYIFLFLKVEGF